MVKKGFFLLEALLACALLTSMVGFVLQHYSQWTQAYRRSKAYNYMITLMHDTAIKPDIGYSITERLTVLEEPIGLPSGVVSPRIKGKEIEVVCAESGQRVCAMVGVVDGE